MAIVLEMIKAAKDGIKLIRTANPFIFGTIQRIKTDREGNLKIVELLHKRQGYFGAIRNHRQMKSDFMQILKNCCEVSTE